MTTKNDEQVRRKGPAVLPDDIANVLRKMKEDPAPFGGVNRVNAYIRHLYRDGKWTYRAIAAAFGVYPQTIVNRVRRADASPSVDVSDLPFVANNPVTKDSDREPRPEMTGAEIKRVRRLQQLASQRRGSTPPDSPIVKASEDLAALFYELRENRKIPLVDIARAAGVTPLAVKQRMGRHDMVPLPPSLQHTRLKELSEDGEGES